MFVRLDESATTRFYSDALSAWFSFVCFVYMFDQVKNELENQ